MLRPIDVTLSIQHATDAHRAGSGHSQSARPEVQHQMFSERLEKQARQQEQQAGEVNASEKNEVTPDRQGDGKGYYAHRRKQQKKSGLTKPEPKKGSMGESMYDIRI